MKSRRPISFRAWLAGWAQARRRSRVQPPPAEPPAPDAPVLLAVEVESLFPVEARLMWSPVAGATGFHIERKLFDAPDAFAEVGVTGPDVSEWIDALPDYGNYRYRVRAADARGFSPYSNVVDFLIT